MVRFSTKLVALIAVLSAIGNVLGCLSIRLPSAPGTTVEFHLSALPSLLIAVSVGPLPGAITGFLSLIMATMQIGNVFIPFGNALLAGIAGLFAQKLKFSPPVSGALAMIPYTPYIWLACMAYNVPQAVIAFIVVKAFIEVMMSGAIAELILRRHEVRNFFEQFKFK
ncbi:MAG: ECF transporter S component [Candidatus Bathyarchaeia archaeon]